MTKEPEINAITNDGHTSILALRELVGEFVADRNWEKFHTPKNLSMSLAIEAGELMEHFQWLTTEESDNIQHEPEKLQQVGEELADVLSYGFALANVLGIDISQALKQKMEKNCAKYPIDRFMGSTQNLKRNP